MAAYASTVKVYVPKAERISRSLGMIAGKIDITNYNATTVKETGITKFFTASGVAGITLGIISCVVTSSEKGYLWSFDKNTGKFKVYQQSAHALSNITLAASTPASVAAFASINEALKTYMSANFVKVKSAADAMAATAAVLTEVADDTDVGEAEFIAVGFIR